MRKVASIIFASLLMVCFMELDSFAFDNPWKNSNPKCRKFDFGCKRKSPKMTQEEVQQIKNDNKKKKIEKVQEIEKVSIEENKNVYKEPKKIFGIFDNPYANADPKCKKFDFGCKRKNKVTPGAIQSDNDENVKVVSTKTKRINNKNTEIGIFTGMFDFSDEKQSAGVLGLEHQNYDLFRSSFLGKISPITGGFITANNAFYIYTGAQAEYELGFLKITPSFAPGYYNSGGGKDLGYPLEFKTEVQATFDFSESTHLGMSYNHISNASLGTKNPGANSYMFNFLKQF